MKFSTLSLAVAGLLAVAGSALAAPVITNACCET